MKAAGLKAIATVVESTAVLIKSKHTSDPDLVNLITSRIKGVISKPPLSTIDRLREKEAKHRTTRARIKGRVKENA